LAPGGGAGNPGFLTEKCSLGREMTPAKQKEQTGLIKNNLIQKMSTGSGVGPGMKTGAA
jgi:hypothetical protein